MPAEAEIDYLRRNPDHPVGPSVFIGGGISERNLHLPFAEIEHQWPLVVKRHVHILTDEDPERGLPEASRPGAVTLSINEGRATCEMLFLVIGSRRT
jgi:hypothetical protein